MGGKYYYYCGGQGRVRWVLVGEREKSEKSQSVSQSGSHGRKVGWVVAPSSSFQFLPTRSGKHTPGHTHIHTWAGDAGCRLDGAQAK